MTIVVPTYNEYENIQPLLNTIENALAGIDWEIIIVDDDSPDDTASLVRKVALTDPRIRCIQRLGRRGLSSACIEGILASSSPYVCIMDADMQHDEELIPEMLKTIKEKKLDLIIGSRYVEYGSTGKLPYSRQLISKFATRLGRLILVNPVNDPMSGFFMVRRDFFEKVMRNLSGKGFKILLDILVSARKSVNYMELPYVMRDRIRGESKLDAIVVYEFFTLLVDKLVGRIFPIRFILFATVGFSGVIVHLLSLGILYRIVEFEFLPSQFFSTYIAMTSNYLLNNIITYRERKLRGSRFFLGLLSFYLSCTLGAIVNIALAEFLFGKNFPWWLAGVLGAVAGAVWNYVITAVFTWREQSVEK